MQTPPNFKLSKNSTEGDEAQKKPKEEEAWPRGFHFADAQPGAQNIAVAQTFSLATPTPLNGGAFPPQLNNASLPGYKTQQNNGLPRNIGLAQNDGLRAGLANGPRLFDPSITPKLSKGQPLSNGRSENLSTTLAGGRNMNNIGNILNNIDQIAQTLDSSLQNWSKQKTFFGAPPGAAAWKPGAAAVSLNSGAASLNPGQSGVAALNPGTIGATETTSAGVGRVEPHSGNSGPNEENTESEANMCMAGRVTVQDGPTVPIGGDNTSHGVGENPSVPVRNILKTKMQLVTPKISLAQPSPKASPKALNTRLNQKGFGDLVSVPNVGTVGSKTVAAAPMKFQVKPLSDAFLKSKFKPLGLSGFGKSMNTDPASKSEIVSNNGSKSAGPEDKNEEKEKESSGTKLGCARIENSEGSTASKETESRSSGREEEQTVKGEKLPVDGETQMASGDQPDTEENARNVELINLASKDPGAPGASKEIPKVCVKPLKLPLNRLFNSSRIAPPGSTTPSSAAAAFMFQNRPSANDAPSLCGTLRASQIGQIVGTPMQGNSRLSTDLSSIGPQLNVGRVSTPSGIITPRMLSVAKGTQLAPTYHLLKPQKVTLSGLSGSNAAPQSSTSTGTAIQAPSLTTPGLGVNGGMMQSNTHTIFKSVHDNEETRLFALSYKFNGDFQVNGVPMLLDVLHPTDSGETGWRVWDAGILMAKYAEKYLVGGQPLKILDLGTGTGIGGIGAALAGNHVILSDKGAVSERTSRNVEMNQATVLAQGGSLAYIELDWLKEIPDHPVIQNELDYIIASDVCWAEVFCTPFLTVLEKLLENYPEAQDADGGPIKRVPKVLMSHKTRSPTVDAVFWKEAADRGWQQTQVHTAREINENFSHPKIHVYEMYWTRKYADGYVVPPSRLAKS